MKNGIKAFLIVSILATFGFASELGIPQDFKYLFLLSLGAQFSFLVILNEFKVLEYDRASNNTLDIMVIYLSALIPITLLGGLHSYKTLIFLFIPIFWTSFRGYGLMAVVGLMLVTGLDALALFLKETKVFPDFHSIHINSQIAWERFFELSAVGFLFLLLATVTKTANKSQSFRVKSEDSVSPVPTSTVASPVAPRSIDKPSDKSSSFKDFTPDEDDLGNLDGVLESIVFFLSKNFKSYTAAGFLSNDGGKTFNLNACFSRKEKNIDRDVLIEKGRGIIGIAVEKENGFMSGDLRSYPEPIEYYEERPEVNSLMAVRITNEKGRIIGVLSVDSDSTRAFNDDDKDLMFRFSKVASMLVSNVKMSQELQENSRVSQLTYGLSKLMSEQLKPNEVLKVLMVNLGRLFHSRRQVLCDISASTGQARILHVSGHLGDIQKGHTFNVASSSSHYAKVFRSGKSENFTEFDLEKFRFGQAFSDETELKQIIVAPIVDERSKAIACIGVEFEVGDECKPHDLTLLNTIALNASSALTKAKIFQKMEKQATIDGLTQIPNHRHFQDLMDMELERAARTKKPVSLLLMDIDHFKKFNDTYGHPVGDLVLKLVSKALSGAVRKTDHIARYGGEEFVVILPQSEGEIGMQSAERVRKAIEDIEIPHESGNLKVTMSIGMATYPNHASNKKDLIDFSDKALYFSKENGRNKVSSFDELKKEA